MESTETMTDAEKQELASNLAIRDRLMRRLRTATISTRFSDDLGAFTVETRMMNAGERERFLKYNKMLGDSAADSGKYSEAMNGLKALTASLCQTKGLGEEYWQGSEASDDVVLTILLNTFNGAAKAVIAGVEGVEQFRKK